MLQFDDSCYVDAKQYQVASFSTRNSALNTSLRKPIRMQDFIQLCDSLYYLQRSSLLWGELSGERLGDVHYLCKGCTLRILLSVNRVLGLSRVADKEIKRHCHAVKFFKFSYEKF